MTDSITPPPELVQQWAKDRALLGDDTPLHLYIAARAAQWGADQELEACCLLLDSPDGISLRAARRPTPSLKEQALLQLDTLNADLAMHGKGCDLSQIRRALEALPND